MIFAGLKTFVKSELQFELSRIGFTIIDLWKAGFYIISKDKPLYQIGVSIFTVPNGYNLSVGVSLSAGIFTS